VRIRSIRPEFWSSEDIAKMDWHTRLVYIGLWSYVDDNGVGRDLERLIVADLFPLDEDLTEASLRVHGALKHLQTHGQITRYTVDGKPFLHVTAWDTHQKVNRPSGSRYPLPTCDDAVPHGALTEPSLSPHDSLSAGEGEKGRRGEGEKAPRGDADFDDFYAAYPKKVGKGAALKAWKAATKKATVSDITAGLKAYLPIWATTDPQFIPNPATWLNQERWADEVRPTKPAATGDEPYWSNW
jgi:hypothetical protein